jgi:hypothetical protein
LTAGCECWKAKSGEKLVTRHILEQTQRNGDDLGTLKARVDHVASDIALVRC